MSPTLGLHVVRYDTYAIHLVDVCSRERKQNYLKSKESKISRFVRFFLPDAEQVDEPESEPFVFCCPVSPHAVLHSNFLPMPVKYELNRLLCFLEKSDRGSICHVYIRNSILSTLFILKNKIILDSDTVSKVLL